MANQVLVVTGMHRSGTSLLTHWLHACGLQVGERLLQAGKGNVEGHFEDLDFLQLHEDILAAHGADTAGLRGPYEVAPSTRQQARMAAVIAARNARHTQWGWKEPRTCLFLDSYAQLLPGANYLVVLRDHEEVVQSLLKRDFSHIDERYQQKSWLHRAVWYFYRPLRLNKHRDRNYNRYLRAWIHYNRMILRALQALPDERYLVVSHELMHTRCAQVYAYLSARWSFRLRYQRFANIYRGDLLSRGAAPAPAAADPGLLAQARELGAELRRHLERSAARLVRNEALMAA
ncbi:hypothetical protein ACLB1G_27115 [Oxalobacteraceae bacterium A2-2]